MRRYVGVFHVHSDFSDGALSLEQIAALARTQQLDFVVCADHAPYLDRGQIAGLVERCAALSGEGLLMAPGLEFELAGRHVVALGPGELLRELAAATVVREPQEVRRRGGFTIWAHPAVSFDWRLKRPMQLAYDAWEIWNRRADGNGPSQPLLMALRKAQSRGQRTQAFAGTDFHRGEALAGPFVALEMPAELTLPALLEALTQGRYQINGLPDQAPGALAELIGFMHYGVRRVYCVLALVRYRVLSAVGLK
jgi:hypothetical protein